MINGNDPITTICSDVLGQTVYEGLSKREHMAIEFTKAMITHYGVHQGTSEKGVKYAIEWTDELIKQLNESK